MAIAFDAVGTGDNGAGGTAGTLSHVATGSNLLLLVTFQTGASGSDLIGTATYAGVSMTKMASVPSSGISETAFYLLGPSTGTNNLIWYLSASAQSRGVSTSYTGVSQSGFPDATATGTVANATSIAGTVTTVADNSWVWSGLANDAGVGTPGASTTGRGTDVSSFAGDNNAAITPAGPGTQNWSFASAFAALRTTSFAPAVATTGPVDFKTLLGVGQA